MIISHIFLAVIREENKNFHSWCSQSRRFAAYILLFYCIDGGSLCVFTAHIHKNHAKLIFDCALTKNSHLPEWNWKINTSSIALAWIWRIVFYSALRCVWYFCVRTSYRMKFNLFGNGSYRTCDIFYHLKWINHSFLFHSYRQTQLHFQIKFKITHNNTKYCVLLLLLSLMRGCPLFGSCAYSSQCEPHITLFDKYEIGIFVGMGKKLIKNNSFSWICSPMCLCHGVRNAYVRRFSFPNNYRFLIAEWMFQQIFLWAMKSFGLAWKKFWRSMWQIATKLWQEEQVEPNHWPFELQFFLCVLKNTIFH